MNLDLLALYAYSDRVHTKDRELWRGFLAFLLPVLLEIESGVIEHWIDSAQSRSPEDVLAKFGDTASAENVLRMISAELAQVLDLPAELGVAAFLEVNVPTRAHLVKPSSLKIKDETMVARWLNKFTKAQHHEEFAEQAARWKELTAQFYDGEDVIEREESESDSEVQPVAQSA